MRSSSVKTLVAALFVVLTIATAVPVHAGPTQTRNTVASARNEPRGIDRVGRIVRRFIARITGNNDGAPAWPSIPPSPTPNQ